MMFLVNVVVAGETTIIGAGATSMRKTESTFVVSMEDDAMGGLLGCNDNQLDLDLFLKLIYSYCY